MYTATVNDKKLQINLDKHTKTINGEVINWDIEHINTNNYHIIKDHKGYTAEVVSLDYETKTAVIKVNNQAYTVSIKDQYDALLQSMGLDNMAAVKVSEIKAPMPGLVLKVLVEIGQEVKKGDSLIVLEAMKMENVLKSTTDGIVKGIAVKPTDKVEKNQVLIKF